ncbi:MarR family winged helix-turn-helix transcriptional regulator [Compostimonas suwonensis]|uniref:DNA-binding MarR family transcriptional regulator n=1 Tax=Compostimonas suwonensis TaxID=1048394 RepID=A0A2M9BCS5_9MICO|nr:hypothetical protein [Compostimonas suwonensis]PJJ55704.1 hypothetical protein CLV54_3055 [Compostimonas suwonensis]
MNTTDRRDQPPIGLLLRKLDNLVNERFERTLGTRDITRRQWQLLHTLAERPTTLDALNTAVAPFLDQAAGETAKQHLDPLAKLGLVTSTSDVYELTGAGRTLFDSLAEDVQTTRDLTVRGLADGEYDRTIANLQAMIANLEDNA